MKYRKCNLCGSEEVKNRFKINDFSIVRCRKCGLEYVNPILEEKDIQEIYQKGYFNGFKKDNFFGYQDYAQDEIEINRTFQRKMRIIDKLMPDKGKILDIGCAMGFFINVAKEDGWEVTGIDLSEEAIKYAKKRFNYDVRCTSLDKAGFKGASFDVITMFDLIEHVEYPDLLIKQCYGLLKPNGLLVITTPNSGSVVAKLLSKRWEEYKRAREHIFFFSRKTLTDMLVKNRFKVVKSHTAGRYFQIRSFFSRLKANSKHLSNALVKFGDFIKINNKVIYVDPKYKMTLYAKKL